MAGPGQIGAQGVPQRPGRSLYRRHRPRSFAELVGQEAVARTLANAVERDRIHHAYLFVGSRGTGKTSTAKILAACLNCERGPTANPCGECRSCQAIAQGSSLDVVEMDAASNNSVDDVRALRESVAYAPTSSYRVYILDEAHMLSTAAWNALLKTLEEPPPRTVFVLATTEAQRVPPTVVDRCHRFDFRRPTLREVASLVERVAEREQIELPPQAAAAIARHAAGSYRDALGTLEQLVTYAGPKLEVDDLVAVLGSVEEELLERLLDGLAADDPRELLLALFDASAEGRDPVAIASELEERARELLVACVLGEVPAELAVSAERDIRLLEQAAALGEGRLLALLEQLAFAREAVRAGAQPRTQLEFALVRAARGVGRGGSPREPQTSAPGPAGSRRFVRAKQPPAVAREGGAPGGGSPPSGGPERAPEAEEPAASDAGLGAPPREPSAEGQPDDRQALAQLQGVWPEFIERLRDSNDLTATLLSETRPVAVSGETVSVGFPPGSSFLQRKAEMPTHLAAATTVLRGLCGRPIQLRYVAIEQGDREPLDEEQKLALLVAEFDARELPAEGG